MFFSQSVQRISSLNRSAIFQLYFMCYLTRNRMEIMKTLSRCVISNGQSYYVEKSFQIKRPAIDLCKMLAGIVLQRTVKRRDRSLLHKLQHHPASIRINSK